jgi:hypothetical protein
VRALYHGWPRRSKSGLAEGTARGGRGWEDGVCYCRNRPNVLQCGGQSESAHTYGKEAHAMRVQTEHLCVVAHLIGVCLRGGLSL